jgi:hypothetical protein
LAAVGAAYVTFQDNDLANLQQAGIYLAREVSYQTFGTFGVTVTRNRITSANMSATGSHDGLLAYADRPAESSASLSFGQIPNTVRDLVIRDNQFTGTLPGSSNGFGIEVRNSCSGGEVSGNTVLRATDPGIVVSGSGFAVSANVFTPR